MFIKSRRFYPLLLSCLWLIFNTSTAQSLFVVRTQGKIHHPQHQRYLTTGDTIKPNDTLTFLSNNAWAVLIGENGKLFLQQPNPLVAKSLCHESIQPIVSTKKSSTSTKSTIDNLQAYFEGEQFVFIGNEFKLTLNQETYPLSDSLFLLYRYEYLERHITIKIPFQKQTLFFDPALLYTYKGEKIPYSQTRNTGIYVFNAIDNMPYTAAKFNPIWLVEEKIKAELSVLKNFYVYKGEPWSDIKSHCLQYILDVYGKTDEAYCSLWIDRHLK